MATTVVASAIQGNIERLINQSTFANHPFARQAITEAASTILNERFYSTSDQVENCIKPFKFDIDIEEREWNQGREHVGDVLKSELDHCQTAMKSLETAVGGRRKLREVMNFVDKVRKGDIVVEGESRSGAGGFSAALLSRGESLLLVLTFQCLNHRKEANNIPLIQAAKLFSFATVPISSTCVCWPSSPSSADP